MADKRSTTAILLAPMFVGVILFLGGGASSSDRVTGPYLLVSGRQNPAPVCIHSPLGPLPGPLLVCLQFLADLDQERGHACTGSVRTGCGRWTPVRWHLVLAPASTPATPVTSGSTDSAHNTPSRELLCGTIPGLRKAGRTEAEGTRHCPVV